MRLFPLVFLLASACMAPTVMSTADSDQQDESTDGTGKGPRRERDGGATTASTSSAGPTSHASPANPEFGVLAADPQFAKEDFAAGVRWALVTLDWESLEPSRGQFEPSALPLDLIAKYRLQGWKIELSLGLHEAPPSWALDLEPWKDQDGTTYRDGANWFNPVIQQAIAQYIDVVVKAIGPDKIDAVRIGGTSGAGEVNYPLEPASYKYTAYSASALAGSSLITKNPAPNCRPPSCSSGDAAVFYAWYVDSLTAFCNFQVEKLRAAGYQGDVQWLFGGGGVTPELKALLLANGLAPTDDVPDDFHVSAAGHDQPEIMAKIADKGPRTVITNTGINDDSTPNAVEDGDDPEKWSAPHWTAFNADRFHLRKSSENVGFQGDGYDDATDMRRAFTRLKQFGYEKLMWAFDKELRTEHGATIGDYAGLIANAAKP